MEMLTRKFKKEVCPGAVNSMAFKAMEMDAVTRGMKVDTDIQGLRLRGLQGLVGN